MLIYSTVHQVLVTSCFFNSREEFSLLVVVMLIDSQLTQCSNLQNISYRHGIGCSAYSLVCRISFLFIGAFGRFFFGEACGYEETLNIEFGLEDISKQNSTTDHDINTA